ncbi:MAG TPA: glycoside hydrolase family 97 protein [Chitinophagaceae bacterium]|nr:glycoside hydrolase family 97 protein [Chitinophagaceae bacterium]
MFKRLLVVYCFFISQQLIVFPSLSVTSPDKTILVTINTKNVLTYTVSIDGNLISPSSVIDFELLNGQKLSGNLSVKSTQHHYVNETINNPFPDTRRNIPNIYNELQINFRGNFSVIFRAYNDGVAYRIITRFKDSIIVKNETAAFNFTPNGHVYAPLIHQRDSLDIFHTSFEEQYQYKPIGSLASTDVMFNPALVETADSIKIGITESDLDDYPGMFLQGTGANALHAAFAPYPAEEKTEPGDYPERVVTKRENYIARTSGTRSFPWRVLIIARHDKDLPANDLVYRLAAPSKLKDVSWIHPGKCTDEWIIDVNLFNVPFKSGVNTASYKYYIDFAKRFGFDRIMMDAGWSDTKDLFKINPAINMDTIAAYARQQGIHLSMWTLSMTLARQLDSAIAQFKKWDVDFIMTDFIDRDDQPTVRFYKRIAEACARAHLMIMFHGAYPPKGFNRTFPHNITREGVLGSEYNAWSDKVTPQHNLTVSYIRNFAGPMDYEPGLLDNATQQQFRPIWGKVMSQGTRCSQLAMFIVYNDPLPIFSGNPSQGYMEPQFMTFLGSLPTLWDTTFIIDGKIGQYIITARRHGGDWYIAGLTDWTARDIMVPLNFLDDVNYNATICKDGINADRYASDYTITQQAVHKSDSITIHLAPGGGFLVKVMKE